MSRAAQAIERIHEIREELNAEIRAVDGRMSECSARMRLLERHGLVPEEEAIARFEHDLDQVARKGETQFQRMVELYARAGGAGGSGISRTISAHHLPNGQVHDPGALLTYLARDQILADAKERISARYRDEGAADRLVPGEDDRRAELRNLEEELEQLKSARDELQDELARSFQFEPSQTAKDRERREHEQQILDGLNRSSREPGPEGAEVLRSPDAGQTH